MKPNEQQTYDGNLLKIAELEPHRQYSAKAWMDYCFGSGDPFRITEAHRSQERQNEKILEGRWTEKDFWDDVNAGLMTTATALKGVALLRKKGGRAGEKVTYTLDSNHTKRLALDIKPLVGGYQNIFAYQRIAKAAELFGITHPYSWDQPHFEVTNPVRQPVLVSIAQRLLQVTTALKFARGLRKVVLTRLRERLLKRQDQNDEG
ncbi:MAG: hypothetical protein AB7O68_16795 [Pirellulales bacterium]